jgi:hypothetical protein
LLESAPVAFQAVVKLRQVSSGIMFCELRGLVDLIYNEIRLLFRFDLGTHPLSRHLQNIEDLRMHYKIENFEL